MRPLHLLLGASLLFSFPALAEDVASILLMQGDVSLSDHRPAAVGMGLERGDTLSLGDDSAAVLILHNNWLVRVDEDLELAVDDIVLLDAPEADRSISEQLDDLLYPDERESMPGLDQAERVAGWHSRLTAAEAPPSQAVEAAPMAVEPSGFDGGGGAVAPSASVPEPVEAVEEIALSVAKTARRTRGRRGLKHAHKEEARPVEAAPAEPVPSPLVALVESGDGRACLDEWLATLPVHLDTLEIILIAEDGVVTRVALGRGLTSPPCLRELLVGEPLEGERLSFTLSLTE